MAKKGKGKSKAKSQPAAQSKPRQAKPRVPRSERRRTPPPELTQRKDWPLEAMLQEAKLVRGKEGHTQIRAGLRIYLTNERASIMPAPIREAFADLKPGRRQIDCDGAVAAQTIDAYLTPEGKATFRLAGVPLSKVKVVHDKKDGGRFASFQFTMSATDELGRWTFTNFHRLVWVTLQPAQGDLLEE